MGRKKQPLKPGPPSQPLPAQGKGGRKRTPTSAFDPAAGADLYEPEKIVGERQKNMGGGKYETQWEVKKHNTYEPIKNLAGCEDMIAKMAKQYLAAPFSSAGVERVFSAASKMHDDLRKSEKDSALEHSLFAAFNAE